MYLSLDSLGNKAKPYVEKAGKMLNLISYLQPYLHKDGLNDAKSDLKLLMDYVTDIAHGNYSNYRTDRLLIIIAALLYVIDPIDVVPDLLVGGFWDDATVIGCAITKVAEELQAYKVFKEGQSI